MFINSYKTFKKVFLISALRLVFFPSFFRVFSPLSSTVAFFPGFFSSGKMERKQQKRVKNGAKKEQQNANILLKNISQNL